MTYRDRAALALLATLVGCAAPAPGELPSTEFEEGKADRTYTVNLTGEILEFRCRTAPCWHSIRLQGDVDDPEGMGVVVAAGTSDEIVAINRRLLDAPADLVEAIDASTVETTGTISHFSAEQLAAGVELEVRIDVEETWNSNRVVMVRAASPEANGELDVRSHQRFDVSQARELIPEDDASFEVNVDANEEPDVWLIRLRDHLDFTAVPRLELRLLSSDGTETDAFYVCTATGEVYPLPGYSDGSERVISGDTDCTGSDDSAEVYLRAAARGPSGYILRGTIDE